VQRIDFGTALAVILEAHSMGQGEKIGEAFLEPLVAGQKTPPNPPLLAESITSSAPLGRPVQQLGNSSRTTN
jgi:hypothetical protein